MQAQQVEQRFLHHALQDAAALLCAEGMAFEQCPKVPIFGGISGGNGGGRDETIGRGDAKPPEIIPQAREVRSGASSVDNLPVEEKDKPGFFHGRFGAFPEGG